MTTIWPDMCCLFREAAAVVRARPAIFLAMPVLAAAATAWFFPRDVALADWIYRDRFEFMRDVARRFSAYGDFRLTLELTLAFWLVGRWKKRRDWQRLGLAILLAASLAGGLATTVRTTTGRPRPSANAAADKFGGPNFTNHKYQSFPSAHAATSMATAGVLAVAVPTAGIPFLIVSVGVPWARFYMHDHYLSDITVGGLLGLWFGLAFGQAQRRLGAR